jgi:reactive chlorine resistance protein C
MQAAQFLRTSSLISIFGTALNLLWIGIFKFTPTEAKGIQSLINHSPFMSWMTPALGVQGASSLIGGIEIVTALLLICITIPNRPFQRLAQLGGILGAATFLCTLSFLATTPGAFSVHDGVLVPDGFLLKDIVLLGASLLCVAEAMAFLHKTQSISPQSPQMLGLVAK